MIGTLVSLGAHFPAYFQLHERLAKNLDRFPKEVGVTHATLAKKLFKCDANGLAPEYWTL